jgi:hypothetical protein
MSTPIGTLTIEMAANVARLQKDMDAAKKTVSDAMGSITKGANTAMNALAGLGATLSVAAFASYIKGAIDAADKLNDLSKATAISVENLSGLDLAAKQSGGDLEGTAQAINKLSVQMGQDAEKFKLLGITAKEPLEAFKQLSDIFVQIKDPQLRAAVAAEALGKSWQSAAPLLAEGSAKIQEMIDKGKDLSGITPELVARADEFNDKLAEIGAAARGASMTIAGGLLPILQSLAEAFTESKRTGGTLSVFVDALAVAFEAVIVIVANVVYVLKQVGLEIVGIAKQLGALATLDFTAFSEIGTQMKADAAAARKEIDAFSESILTARKRAEELDAVKRANKVDDQESAAEAAAAAAAAKSAQEFINYKKEGADSYQKMIDKANELVNAIQFETAALTMSNVEKETAIALQKLLNLGIKEGTAEWQTYSEAVIFATIEKEQMQKLVDERKKIDEKAIADRLKAEEKYAKEVEQINEQIGQSLTDALMQGGITAKDFLVNMFKTMILRPMLQPIITGMVGGFTSAALPAAAEDGSAGGSVGGTLGLVSLASSLKSAYTMVTTGFTTLGSTVTNFVAESAGFLMQGAEAGSMAMEMGVTLAESAGAIGSLASSAAGIGAGLMLGNLISDGKGIGGTNSMIAPGVGTAIGFAVGGPLGAAIGGVVGGLANAAFGTGKKEIDDTGLKITFNSMGAVVKQYEDWSKKGGWLSGGSKGTDLKEIDSELQKYFDTSVGAVALSVQQYTDILKLPARDLTQYSLEIEKSLEGLSPEETKKAIDASIKAYADGLSGFAAAEIAPFQRSGEVLSDTLARLGSSLKTVNDTFGILNISLYDSSVAGADAASKLADAFGGLDKFIAATDAYYQNFYSAQERADKTTENLTTVFEQLGLTLPSTNAEFRALVEAARAAGNDTLFANLIKLAPAFSNLKNSLSSLVDAALQNVQAVIQTERTAALAAITAQEAIAQATKDVATENISTLTTIFDYLTDQVDELTGAVSSAQSAAEGMAFIQDAIASATSTGYLPDQSDLESAVSAVRAGIDATSYASSYEQKLAQMQLAAQLSSLNSVAEEQKTTAELQLEVAQETLDDLAAQAIAVDEYYDAQLAYAQAQVDELRAVNGAVLTLAGAMIALQSAVSSASLYSSAASSYSASTVSSASSVDSSRTGQIDSLYQEILGRSAEAAGLDAWNNSGLSIDEIRAGIMSSSEAQARGYATGGYYPGGLAMVGEQGPELINFNRPGQVYTAGQTAEILSNGSLASEIKSLRSDIQAQARATAQIQLRTAKVLERWESSGMPDVRLEV